MLSELPKMSWRRFLVLLNGLSGDSIYVANFRAKKDGTMAIDVSEGEADRLVDTFFK